jgi:hypothetical protein
MTLPEEFQECNFGGCQIDDLNQGTRHSTPIRDIRARNPLGALGPRLHTGVRGMLEYRDLVEARGNSQNSRKSAERDW